MFFNNKHFQVVLNLYYIQMKKTFISLIFACVLSLGLSQGFTGGYLPSLQTGTYVLQSTTQILSNVTYSVALSRSPFSVGQEIHIATSLQDFSFNAYQFVAANRYYVHIQIDSLSLNSNLKNLQFQVKTTQIPSNVLNIPYRIRRIKINYIVVGSNFAGYYNETLPDTYIFPRNSIMVQPVAATTTLVDFRTTQAQAQSPFLYNPSLSNYQGCGAVKKDGNWIIQTARCAKITATLFVTGLDYNIVDAAAGSINIGSAASTIAERQINLQGSTAIFNADSTQDGLRVQLTQTNYNFVQLSMIVIAIRQYTANIYPIQGVTPDNFNANSFITTGALLATANPTQTITRDTGAFPFYNVDDSSWSALSFGHRFCGLNGVSITNPSLATTPRLIGFSTDVTTGWSPSLVFTGSSTVSFTTTSTTDAPYANMLFGESCLLFTAKNPCTQTLTALTIQNPSNSITPSTSGSVTYSGSGSYAGSGDLNLLTPVNVLASHTITSIPSTIVHTGTFITPPTAGVFEGVISFTTTGAIPSPVVQFTVTLQILGGQVLLQTNDVVANKYYHFSFQNLAPTNTFVITVSYSAASASASSFIHVIQFALFKHTNVVTLNQTCASNCTTFSGFSTGVDYSTVPPKCVICDLSLNLVFNPITGTCTCASGYFFGTGGICQPCTATLCGTCTASTCSRCTANSAFVSSTDPTQGCRCNTGFYQSGNQCPQCAPGCVSCTTGTACTTCVANSNTRQDPAQNCACKPGFYETNVAVCPACSPECLTCSGSAINCLTCNTAGNFEPSGTTCNCKSGFYLATVGTGIQCLKCHFSCATCQGDAAKCLTCKSTEWTKVGNECVCNKVIKYVYYDNVIVDGFCVDQKCTTINPQCTECQLILLSGQTVCTKCNDANNFVLSSDNKTCVCKPGFYSSAGSCLACGTGCFNCASPTSCSLCALGASNNTDGSCSCPPGTYLSSSFGTLQCLPCNDNCAECQVAPDVCTRCINGFSTINNKCVCPAGKYATPDNINCRSCSTGCTQCTSPTSCTACGSGYILSGSACTLNCPQGTFNGGDQCYPCSDGCKSCNSRTDCRACNSPKLLFGGSCRDSCPAGTFPFSNSLCIACTSGCATCVNSPNNCLSCSGTLVLSGNQCIAGCPPGTFFNGVSCGPCSAPCVTCTGTATTCASCPAGQYLYNSQCFTTCPTAIVNGVCTNICPDGQFLSGTVCQRCSSSCKTCSSATVCTSCNANLVQYKGNCQATCPANTLKSGNTCLDCDSTCSGCSGSTTSCINCAPGTYRLADKCYTTCPISYYLDSASSTCKQCDAGCRSCFGPGQCSVCLDNSAPNGGFCSGSCGANCLQCQGDTCVKCSPNTFWNGQSCQTFCPSGSTPVNGVCTCSGGQILHQGTCVFNCPAGFLNVGGQCFTCDSPCKTCASTLSTCSSCIDGYTYDVVNKKCLQITDCPAGQYLSNFGDCRFICPEDTYYHQSACYVGKCPVGFSIDSKNRVCVQSSLPSGCSQPLFLQGVNCVTTCQSGFYPNLNDRICTPCSSNCVGCSGPNQCSSCAVGTTLLNKICVLNSDPCPANQFRYKQYCVSNCPVGTFNNNGFCTRLCASGLYYYNSGCYETCPTNLNTQTACVIICPVGTRKNGNQCIPTVSNSCGGNQYYNSAIGACDNCKAPCSTCQGASTFCTSCNNNFSLRAGGVCVNNNLCSPGFYSTLSGCLACQKKCSTCIDQNTCTSCSQGFTSSGSDCVSTSIQLTQLQLQVIATVRDSRNIVYIQIQANALPNNIPSLIAGQFFIFIPNIPNPTTKINIWIQDGFIFVALTHPSTIPTYKANLFINSNLLDSIYRSMGFKVTNVFLEVPISSDLPLATVNLRIPSTATNSYAEQKQKIKINKSLNNAIAAALNEK